jgi:adenylate kinase
MKIVIIGIQGAGKSTQGNLLSEKLKCPYLSTGHIFRELAKEKTQMGRYIKETITAGLLVPDSKVLSIVTEYLQRPEYQGGFIIDGFPRTCDQAKAFAHEVDKVVYLRVSDKEALWRLSYRNGEVREDETVKAVRKRIELFHDVTEPVLDYYREKGILAEIDGEKTVEEVQKEISEKLGL